MDKTFEQLVAEAKKNNKEAAEEIIIRLKPLIFANFRHGSNKLDREDLYQELCLTTLEAIQNYNPDKKVPFLAYVKRAMLYKIWNLNKCAKYEISIDAENELGDSIIDRLFEREMQIEESVQKKQEILKLKDDLRKLSAKQRQVITLHYYNGMKLVQIAKERRVHPKSIMRLKERALAALQKESP